MVRVIRTKTSRNDAWLPFGIARLYEPSRVTRTRCPVCWSRMRYSPGDDSASFLMHSLAVTHVSAAPRQSTLPSESVLKISRGQNIAETSLSLEALLYQF